MPIQNYYSQDENYNFYVQKIVKLSRNIQNVRLLFKSH